MNFYGGEPKTDGVMDEEELRSEEEGEYVVEEPSQRDEREEDEE